MMDLHRDIVARLPSMVSPSQPDSTIELLKNILCQVPSNSRLVPGCVRRRQRQCKTSSGTSFFPSRLHIMDIALMHFGTRDAITAGKSGDVLHEHVDLAFSYSCIVELPFSVSANPGKLLGSSYVAWMTQQSYLIGIYGQ